MLISEMMFTRGLTCITMTDAGAQSYVGSGQLHCTGDGIIMTGPDPKTVEYTGSIYAGRNGVTLNGATSKSMEITGDVIVRGPNANRAIWLEGVGPENVYVLGDVMSGNEAVYMSGGRPGIFNISGNLRSLNSDCVSMVGAGDGPSTAYFTGNAECQRYAFQLTTSEQHLFVRGNLLSRTNNAVQMTGVSSKELNVTGNIEAAVTGVVLSGDGPKTAHLDGDIKANANAVFTDGNGTTLIDADGTFESNARTFNLNGPSEKTLYMNGHTISETDTAIVLSGNGQKVANVRGDVRGNNDAFYVESQGEVLLYANANFHARLRTINLANTGRKGVYLNGTIYSSAGYAMYLGGAGDQEVETRGTIEGQLRGISGEQTGNGTQYYVINGVTMGQTEDAIFLGSPSGVSQTLVTRDEAVGKVRVHSTTASQSVDLAHVEGGVEVHSLLASGLNTQNVTTNGVHAGRKQTVVSTEPNYGSENGRGAYLQAGSQASFTYDENVGRGTGDGLVVERSVTCTSGATRLTISGQNFGDHALRISGVGSADVSGINTGRNTGVWLLNNGNITINGNLRGALVGLDAVNSGNVIVNATVTGEQAVVADTCDLLDLQVASEGTVDATACRVVEVDGDTDGKVTITNSETVAVTGANEGGIVIINSTISVLLSAPVKSDNGDGVVITNSTATIDITGPVESTDGDGVVIERCPAPSRITNEVVGSERGIAVTNSNISITGNLVRGHTVGIEAESSRILVNSTVEGGDGRSGEQGGNALVARLCAWVRLFGDYWGGNGGRGSRARPAVDAARVAAVEVFDGEDAGEAIVIDNSVDVIIDVVAQGGHGGPGVNGGDGAPALLITGVQDIQINGQLYGGQGGLDQQAVVFPCGNATYGTPAPALEAHDVGVGNVSGYMLGGLGSQIDVEFDGTSIELTFENLRVRTLKLTDLEANRLVIFNSQISHLWANDNNFVNVRIEELQSFDVNLAGSQIVNLYIRGLLVCALDLRSNPLTVYDVEGLVGRVLSDSGSTLAAYGGSRGGYGSPSPNVTLPDWCPYCGYVAPAPGYGPESHHQKCYTPVEQRVYERSPESSYEERVDQLCVSKVQAQRMVDQFRGRVSYGPQCRCRVPCNKHCVCCARGFSFDVKGNPRC